MYRCRKCGKRSAHDYGWSADGLCGNCAPVHGEETPTTTAADAGTAEEADHFTYAQQYRQCGKPNCKCASGQGHGPYWYAFWTSGGKTRSKYIGKELHKTASPKEPATDEPTRQAQPPSVPTW